jgi:hypothetical protein
MLVARHDVDIAEPEPEVSYGVAFNQLASQPRPSGDIPLV